MSQIEVQINFQANIAGEYFVKIFILCDVNWMITMRLIDTSN